MLTRFAVTFAVVLAACGLALPGRAALPPPPVAKKIPVTDDYFGTKVVDPYRWMERPNDADLAVYLKAQSERTRSILDSIPGRKDLVTRLTSLADTVTSSSSLIRRKNDIFTNASRRARTCRSCTCERDRLRLASSSIRRR